jgi:hypothetical protein
LNGSGWRVAGGGWRGGLNGGLVSLAAGSLIFLTACSESAPTYPSAPAWDPSVQLDDSTFVIYHWPLGKIISIYPDTSNAPVGGNLPDELVLATQAWSRVISHGEFHFALVDDPHQADVVVQYSSSNPLVQIPAGCPRGGGAGVTVLCIAGRDVRPLSFVPAVGGDSHVKMAVSVRYDDPAEFHKLVAHELGHVLGIGRTSPDSQDLMFILPGSATPTAADTQTLLYLLHQPSALNFGS